MYCAILRSYLPYRVMLHVNLHEFNMQIDNAVPSSLDLRQWTIWEPCKQPTTPWVSTHPTLQKWVTWCVDSRQWLVVGKLRLRITKILLGKTCGNMSRVAAIMSDSPLSACSWRLRSTAVARAFQNASQLIFCTWQLLPKLVPKPWVSRGILDGRLSTSLIPLACLSIYIYLDVAFKVSNRPSICLSIYLLCLSNQSFLIYLRMSLYFKLSIWFYLSDVYHCLSLSI